MSGVKISCKRKKDGPAVFHEVLVDVNGHNLPVSSLKISAAAGEVIVAELRTPFCEFDVELEESNVTVIREDLKLRAALEYAVDIIESYELDVRNSDKDSGGILDINLKDVGFCQGRIYQQALGRIRKLAGDEE